MYQEVLVKNVELNKLTPNQKMSKGERRVQSLCPTNLPEFFWLESILAEWCWATRKEDPGSEWLARDNLETNPITIKPETEPHSRAVLPRSLTLLLSARHPFPIKSLAWLALFSSDNSFLSVR